MVAGLADAPRPDADLFGPRLVVKVGSSLLVTADGTVRRDWLAGLVADIAARVKAGQQVVVVSSGAIALGARRLGLPRGGRASLEDAQAAAATGQIALSSVWAELLGNHGLTAAQLLVTLDDLEDRRRYLNVAATLGRLLKLGVVPVVNENDSVATEEIRFGDNDRLAARVGAAARANGVILLSDIDGLYDSNPHANPDARLIPHVETIDATILGMADSRSSSGMGSGGMVSKVEAARIATAAGATLAIASGRIDHPLARFAATGHGTVFAAPRHAPARKAWLSGGLTDRGAIRVDAGAVAALASGRSLLPAGAVSVEGDFARGDLIRIVATDGRTVARGLAEYDAVDAARIVGRRSDELGDLLGYAPRSALVHRNHMALL
ncbi:MULTISPECIES: glutamate 5-kinase [unclassified Sphingomonas]|uniref:glutamate 5-kinase n=1 Tax=unclassified Sphingomonas TaxID=196159 RepID=UPI0006F9EB77|nr:MULTISPECIES: glutamate 5-kinase [unclassified Sphingomonas]KQN06362.1 glutamate 5-kinase [Sphingomonas sp. Leaf25]KQN40406.1 glutamate 5-kinase [Sphingomonas sp. Leaf42]KQT29760.1 glutamate 5-kinase [Sphingomonas sp. Leaf407]